MANYSPQVLAELRYEGDVYTSALGFTPAELAENRRGRIPMSQKERLWKQAAARLVIPATAFTVLSAAGLVLGLLSVGVLTSNQVFGAVRELGFEPPILYAPLAAITFLVAAAGISVELWFGAKQLLTLRRDLSSGHTASVEGRTQLNSELVWGFSFTTRCWLVVNSRCYEVTSGGPMELPARGPCRVYYTPGSRMVLSVEAA